MSAYVSLCVCVCVCLTSLLHSRPGPTQYVSFAGALFHSILCACLLTTVSWQHLWPVSRLYLFSWVPLSSAWFRAFCSVPLLCSAVRCAVLYLAVLCCVVLCCAVLCSVPLFMWRCENQRQNVGAKISSQCPNEATGWWLNAAAYNAQWPTRHSHRGIVYPSTRYLILNTTLLPQSSTVALCSREWGAGPKRPELIKYASCNPPGFHLFSLPGRCCCCCWCFMCESWGWHFLCSG